MAGQCDGGPQDTGVTHGTLLGALHALSALASDAMGKIVMNGTFSLTCAPELVFDLLKVI